MHHEKKQKQKRICTCRRPKDSQCKTIYSKCTGRCPKNFLPPPVYTRLHTVVKIWSAPTVPYSVYNKQRDERSCCCCHASSSFLQLPLTSGGPKSRHAVTSARLVGSVSGNCFQWLPSVVTWLNLERKNIYCVQVAGRRQWIIWTWL